MQLPLASQTAEVTLPEREKFTAPLLLLPGLWTGAWVWNEAAWAFSQRGWACWALDPSAPGHDSLDERVAGVTAAAAALDRPPVVVAYDAGGVLALLAVQHRPAAARVRALVCVSPLLPCNWQAGGRPVLPLVRPAALPALLWNRAHPAPRRRMARHFLFHTLAANERDALCAKLRSDSGRVVRALTRSHVAPPAVPLPCPVLVAWGEDDRMVSSAVMRRFGATLHARTLAYAAQGHWLLSGAAAATLVGDVHRWLIRTLGDSLLMPPEEEPTPAAGAV